MPEDAFDNFLDHLTRTMRLGTAQRRAIAAELRDHLDLRLRELTDQGLDPEQAIQTALAEFGEAHALAQAFAQPRRQRTRRHLMQTLAATAAVTGLAATLTFFTANDGAEQPADTHAALPHTAPTQAQPIASVPVNAARAQQVDADRFALNEDLFFLAHSEAVIERPDAEPLAALTAFGLEFSHQVPQGVFRETTWPSYGDPYLVQAPEGVKTEDIQQQAVAGAQADPADHGRLLYAVLSTVSTPIKAGQFRVMVALIDDAGEVVGGAEADVRAPRGMLTKPNGHTLQKHLLIFDQGLDLSRVAKVEVEVHEVEVQLPDPVEPEQKHALAEPDPGQDTELISVLETTTSSKRTEMRVLSQAIAELNNSMDVHRRFFEKSLADPNFTTERQKNLAHWKMHSLQSLRNRLQGQYTTYMLGC